MATRRPATRGVRRTASSPRPAPRRRRTGRTRAARRWEVRPLAAVGAPVRLALTLSLAGFALAGAAWRSGWRS